MIKKLIHRPIAVSMCVLALIVLGVTTARLLPISLMPQVDIEQITVKVNAPNVPARQLQNTVVTPLRQQLMQTPYLSEIKATTKDGSATIFMQFDYGTDIDYTFIDVNERVDKTMRMLPKDIERPAVVKASATDLPAFFVNVTLKETKESEAHLMQLSDFATNVIVKRFEQLPQVAFVDYCGASSSQLSIEPNITRMQALGVNIDMLEKEINANNVNLGNLTIQDGQYRYNIRFSTTVESETDILNLPLNINGRVYKLGDLAEVKQELRTRSEIIRSDGKCALSMAIIKQSEARMDDLQIATDKLIKQMEKQYENVEFTVTRDQTELLNETINNLKGNLVVGAILACLVIFIFMQDLRTPLLVTLTIPLSFLLSMLLLFIAGISINIVSLSGLMLGLGMMVDNSIIVIDNISQRWDRGDNIADAVIKGTGEVFSALLSSVMTTCSIFLPLIFLSGVAGAMFYDQALAVTIGLVSSLAIAMTIIPVYYFLLYRKSICRTKNKYLEKYGIPEMVGPYEKSLKWVFRHQIWFWVLTGLITLSAIFVYPMLEKRSLPEVEKNDAMLIVNWNESIDIAQNDIRSNELVAALGEDIIHYTSISGRHTFSLSHTAESGRDDALVYIQVTNNDALNDIFERAQNFISLRYPSALLTIKDAGNLFDMIFNSGDPMLIARLRPVDNNPPKADKLNPLLAKISKELEGVSLEPVVWQEHITMYPDRALLSLYKVTPNSLYTTLQSAFNDHQILTVHQGKQSLPVVIGSNFQSLQDIISTTTVESSEGVDIPISLLVRQGSNRDLNSIVSGSEGNYYPLELEVEDWQVENTMRVIKEVVEKDPEFEVTFKGEWFSGREMLMQLIVVLIISLLLLYFILASQFESLLQPLIILSEIAIDLSGALFLLWICGESLNLMSMIGLIVMSGIVINDSILKVDTFNRLRKEGFGTLRAVLTGGERRLKPIIMTSLTTIMAIVPFLFASGMSNDLQRPLSIAIIGGMVIGTIFSIYGIPLIYYYIYRRK